MSDETKTEAIEAEVMEEPTAVVKSTASLASGISDLATREDAIEVIERAAQSLISLRRASIFATNPHDWTLYKADERITGYLEALACWNLRPLWGVDTVEPSEPYKIEHEDGTFAWALDASGYCNTTKTTISKVTGICYSNEDFLIHRNLPPIKLEPQMKITARQRLEGILVREAGGLKRVPVEELDDVWKNTWKSSRLCPHGRGFGSTAERRGAQVQQSEIEPQYQPRCETCNSVMKFIPAGTTQQGKPYTAFWACPSKEHKYTIRHEQALAEAEARKKEKREEAGGNG